MFYLIGWEERAELLFSISPISSFLRDATGPAAIWEQSGKIDRRVFETVSRHRRQERYLEVNSSVCCEDVM